MRDIKLRRFAFEMERVSLQHRMSNMDVEFLEDVGRQDIIIDMTRRMAVRREMFENLERKPEVTRKVETVSVVLHFPLTWWDHAKAETWLARLVGWGWLKPIEQREHRGTRRIETERTERHYIQQVTVLDDQREIPAHQNAIEFGMRERPDGTLEEPGDRKPSPLVDPADHGGH